MRSGMTPIRSAPNAVRGEFSRLLRSPSVLNEHGTNVSVSPPSGAGYVPLLLWLFFFVAFLATLRTGRFLAAFRTLRFVLDTALRAVFLAAFFLPASLRLVFLTWRLVPNLRLTACTACRAVRTIPSSASATALATASTIFLFAIGVPQ